MKALLVLLVASLSVSAQTFTVTDNSPSDSPVTLSGTVTIDTANPTSNVCSLVWHNSSSKAAVAWKWNVSGSVLGYFRHDPFFRDPSLLDAFSVAPNSVSSLTALDLDCALLTGGFQSTTLWVQFSDGSTWGDSTAQSYVMAQRTNALNFVKALSLAYSNGGAAALQQALDSYSRQGQSAQDTMQRTEAFSTRLKLAQMQTINAQLAEVNRMLSVASLRASWMK